MNAKDTEKLEHSLLHSVKVAGSYVHDKWYENYQVRVKVDGSKQTEVDVSAEQILREDLTRKHPDFGFIVEEGESTARQDLNFVLDPIDGTRYFDGKVPMFFTQAAIVDRDLSVIVAAIYNPISSQMFSYSLNNGTKLNGQLVPQKYAKPLSKSTIAVNLGDHTDTHFDQKFCIFERLARVSRVVCLSGSPAPYLCFNAFDAYINISTGDKLYDILPRIGVWEGIGLRWELFNIPSFREVMIAAPPNLFDEIKSLALEAK